MLNGLSPPYLSDLVPTTVNNSSNHNLRNSNNILLITITLFFSQQFATGVTYQRRIDNVDSAMAFKSALSRDKPVVPKHYLF